MIARDWWRKNSRPAESSFSVESLERYGVAQRSPHSRSSFRDKQKQIGRQDTYLPLETFCGEVLAGFCALGL